MKDSGSGSMVIGDTSMSCSIVGTPTDKNKLKIQVNQFDIDIG